MGARPATVGIAAELLADGKTVSPFAYAKRALIGRPLASERLDHERLNKKTALAVLSSDAISSVAYATDQILFALGGAMGVMALQFVVPISAVIVGLLALVGVSYRQTIAAYPSGGGSYTVAKENLGQNAGLVAAAALLTDYVLTVAVSVSGGVAAMTSAYPSLVPHTVAISVGAIALLMFMNLRGVRESGVIFSIPTYVFIAMMLGLIGCGLWQLSTPDAGAVAAQPVAPPTQPAGLSTTATFALAFLLMRGFAEGCVAMTGTEAISNGVQLFKAPSSRNAATTLGWMVAILAVFFLGVSYLAEKFSVMPTTQETVISQLGHVVFGSGAAYYILQYSTFALLVLAANTAFNDFPRLAGILAADKYVPAQFAARGDRLAFSNGIIVLGLVAMLLVWLFRGNTNALIPLYAIGVFVCFTLSQAGMVKHWLREKSAGWQWRSTLNGVGALATAVVAIVQIVTKFHEGGWIVVLLIPALILLLHATHTHYRRFAIAVRFRGRSPITPHAHTVVVPMSSVNQATAAALVYATTMSRRVHVVHVEVDPTHTAAIEQEWDRWDIGFELEVLPSPYRSVVQPLVAYVLEKRAELPGTLVTVVTPVLVPRHWWEQLLHNKTALMVRAALMFKPNVVVVAVPYFVGHAYDTPEDGPQWAVDTLRVMPR